MPDDGVYRPSSANRLCKLPNLLFFLSDNLYHAKIVLPLYEVGSIVNFSCFSETLKRDCSISIFLRIPRNVTRSSFVSFVVSGTGITKLSPHRLVSTAYYFYCSSLAKKHRFKLKFVQRSFQ